jgi:AbrB family looped-hinge helix DNA binding protein
MTNTKNTEGTRSFCRYGATDEGEEAARRAGTRREQGQQENWESTGMILPMEATVDHVGRIVLPKPLRDRLRLRPGTKVDVSEYGNGLHIAPMGRTAQLEERDGRLVAVAKTRITDDDVLGLIDAGRK